MWHLARAPSLCLLLFQAQQLHHFSGKKSVNDKRQQIARHMRSYRYQSPFYMLPGHQHHYANVCAWMCVCVCVRIIKARPFHKQCVVICFSSLAQICLGDFGLFFMMLCQIILTQLRAQQICEHT